MEVGLDFALTIWYFHALRNMLSLPLNPDANRMIEFQIHLFFRACLASFLFFWIDQLSLILEKEKRHLIQAKLRKFIFYYLLLKWFFGLKHQILKIMLLLFGGNVIYIVRNKLFLITNWFGEKETYRMLLLEELHLQQNLQLFLRFDEYIYLTHYQNIKSTLCKHIERILISYCYSLILFLQLFY